ncbi:hypothetical protein Cs308_0995 [Candidatus Chlamydia sanziniae]|uniref:Uncharacterized protein n=1 Tax=Candidatus Chlamydia sanziniae TaxID=1806891 RepID=A0A1A9HWE3_9CHLA|nr:hypothetical protein Cs308_0995 [Candidatus Chlamydia sanziniae]
MILLFCTYYRYRILHTKESKNILGISLGKTKIFQKSKNVLGFSFKKAKIF